MENTNVTKQAPKIFSYENESSKHDHLFFKIDTTLIPTPGFHDSYEIIYIIKGQARLVLSNQTYPLEEGDMCIVAPNQVHFYNVLSKTISAIVMVMGNSYSHHFRHFAIGNPPTLMTNKDSNAKIYKVLIDWLNDSNKTFLKNCAYANLLFNEISENYPTNIPSDTDPEKLLSFQFIDYIQEHFSEDITLESASKHFSYSKEYFCALFKKTVGQSFLSVLNATRMRNVLETYYDPANTKSLEQISFEFGYKSTTTFYRQYKQYMSNEN